MERYVLHAAKTLIEDTFEVSSPSEVLFKHSFNIYPGSPMPIIYNEEQGRSISTGIWGINDSASDEAITEIAKSKLHPDLSELKPCIIPASGFYMWKQSVNDRLPFYVRMLSQEVLGFAGMYKVTESSEGKTNIQFAVITKASNVLLQPLGPTMPLILEPDHYSDWLEGQHQPLLTKFYKDTDLIPDLAVYRVPDLVNDPSENSRALIQAIPKRRDDD